MLSIVELVILGGLLSVGSIEDRDKALNECQSLGHMRYKTIIDIVPGKGKITKRTELEIIQYRLDTIRKEIKDYQKSK